MSDRLSEIFENRFFANAPGLVSNADSRGNSVLSPEQMATFRRNVQSEETYSTHPFKCASQASSSTLVTAGTVNGVSATSLLLNVGTSGTRYIYLDVTMALDTSTNNYVTGFNGGYITSVSCKTGSNVPVDSSTHLYRQIASYVNGVKISQDITTSMEVVVRDDGTGTGKAIAIWGQS